MPKIPMEIVWEPSNREYYCVDSYLSINNVPGNRCQRHEGHPTACYVSTRNPLCEHERSRVGAHHTYPGRLECKDCGRVGRPSDSR